MKKTLITLVCLCFVSSLLFYFRRDKIADAPESPGPSINIQKKFKRVVFISIDTLRADHLSCYGYPRTTTPFLDGLAKQGVRFTRSLSPISTTAPSHTSMLTGLYPFQHKVMKNGDRLNDSFTTLAEVLQKQGFMTIGFSSTNVHFKSSNLAQGFNSFDEPSDEYITDSMQKTGKMCREAEKTVDEVIHLFNEENTPDKFFLFVHLFDPHQIYAPPRQYLDEITASPPDPDAATDYLINQQHIKSEFYPDKQQLLQTINAYDGEIRYVDAELARLFDALQARGLGNETLWVITSDHGEGLGAHQYAGHGRNLYNEQIHVPLIFYPSPTDEVFEINEIVQNIDLMPTITHLLGAELESLLPYKIEGVSLLPLLNPGSKWAPRKYGFTQRRAYEEKPAADASPTALAEYEAGEKFGIFTQQYKLIYNTLSGEEMYDLATDPYETVDLAGQARPTQAELKNTLDETVQRLKKNFQVERTTVDKKTIKGLKELGYTQ